MKSGEAKGHWRKLAARLLRRRGVLIPNPAESPGKSNSNRTEAAEPRRSYPELFAQAHLMYARGLTPEQVLLNHYGVHFPYELYVSGNIARGFPVDLTNLPWKLISPQVKDSPHVKISSMAELEDAILERDPDLVPLALLLDSLALHGGTVVCYRVTELAAGRTTVFSLPRRLPPGVDAVRAGESFLAVMHTHHASLHGQLKQRLESESNRGDGSMDEDAVAAARVWLDGIEHLQRQVGAMASELSTRTGTA